MAATVSRVKTLVSKALIFFPEARGMTLMEQPEAAKARTNVFTAETTVADLETTMVKAEKSVQNGAASAAGGPEAATTHGSRTATGCAGVAAPGPCKPANRTRCCTTRKQQC
ncbi:MAG: hypothetical protein LBD24_07940 [Spirochaetaceae bacterium]|nr:hypothetical protein [Spirochaetaceae bacterium]